MKNYVLIIIKNHVIISKPWYSPRIQPRWNEDAMPGGNGRPQGGMNRRNHHDSLGQSGQQRRSGSGGGGQPRSTYRPAPNQKSWIDQLFNPPKSSGKGKKKR